MAPKTISLELVMTKLKARHTSVLDREKGFKIISGKKVPIKKFKNPWPFDPKQFKYLGEHGAISIEEVILNNIRDPGIKADNRHVKKAKGKGGHIEAIKSMVPGLGAHLIKKTEETAIEKGYNYLYLHTSNPKLIALLPKTGYKRFGKDKTDKETRQKNPLLDEHEIYFIKMLRPN